MTTSDLGPVPANQAAPKPQMVDIQLQDNGKNRWIFPPVVQSIVTNSSDRLNANTGMDEIEHMLNVNVLIPRGDVRQMVAFYKSRTVRDEDLHRLLDVLGLPSNECHYPLPF